jgi:RNA ligase
MQHSSIAVIDIAAFREREAQGLITARTHPTEDLIIWNYTPQCQYAGAWDEVTLQARGLITKSDGTVVARAFQKFFNYEQHQGDLPLEPFKVTEKLDGSLGILFFINDTPYIATRGSFTSDQALRATRILHERYKDFFPHLRATSQYTYLFEIIFPANRVVVDYGDMEDLVLLAMIRTDTGEEYDIHDPAVIDLWPFPVTKYYDGIADIAELRKREEANREGFVIRFESGLRIKMKMAEYIRLHRILTQVNARVIWERLRDKQAFDDLLERVPDEFYAWIADVRNGLLAQYKAVEDESKALYERVKDLPTRKEQAAIVLRQREISAVVFHMLDGKDYQDIIWKQLRPEAQRPFREDEA